MEKVKKTVLTALAAAAMACLTAGLVFTLPAKTVFAAEVEVRDETTLQSAITNANAGDTIKLMADVTASITVPEDKEITLDLNGFTLTDDGNHTITNYGKLTIVDNSAEGDGTVDNVTHARGALFNLGEATLLGGDYTRSKENGSSATESGGNSWYVIKNLGYLTIGTADGESDVSVSQNGRFSSMITNGYFDNDNTGDHEQYYSSVTTDDKVPTLTIYGGTFSGGINTVKNDNHSVANIIGGTFTNVSQAVVLNWNNLSISGGEFEVDDQAIAAIITSYANTGYNNGETAITDGEFHGEIIADASPDSVTYSISGGTFTEDIPEAYIAEGSMFYPTENGYAVADQAKAEAELSEGAVICGNKAYADFDTAAADGVVAAIATADGKYTGYATLSDAMSSITDATATTVELINDVSTNQTVNFPADTKVTLDLNSKNVTFSGTNGYFNLAEGSEVTIVGEGNVVGSAGAYGVFSSVGSTGKLTIQGGVYSKPGFQTEIFDTSGAPFNTFVKEIVIEGGTFESRVSASATTSTTLMITGGIFNGAVTISNTGSSISGGTFANCPSVNYLADDYNIYQQTADSKFVVMTETDAAAGVADGTLNLYFSGDSVAYVANTQKSYESFEAAVADVTTGTTIQLLRDAGDITLDDSSKEITLDLNGHNVNNINVAAGTLKVVTTSTASLKGAILGTVTVADTNAPTLQVGVNVSVVDLLPDAYLAEGLVWKNSDMAVANYQATTNMDTSANVNVTIGGVTAKFASISAAALAIPEGSTATIQLINDLTLYGQVNLTAGKNITLTLDLGGFTLTLDHAQDSSSVYGTLVFTAGNVTIQNGSIVRAGADVATEADETTDQEVTDSDSVMLNIQGARESTNDTVVEVTLESGLNIATDSTGIFISGYGAKLNTSANITTTSSTWRAIEGNGSVEGYTTVNVEGGTISAPNSVAIYQPQAGTLNITNGTVTGGTAVFVRSGKVNIDGGTLSAIGDAAELPDDTSSGTYSTGDALVILNSNYPGGEPEVSITAGTLNSTNGQSVRSEAVSGKDPVEGFVSGGNFSTPVAASYLADGYMQVVDAEGNTTVGETGTVDTTGAVAQVGENAYYADLQEALDNAIDGETVKLLGNATVSSTLTINKAITLDLNGFDVTANGCTVFSVSSLGAAITNTNEGDVSTISTTGNIAISIVNAVAQTRAAQDPVIVSNVTVDVTFSGSAVYTAAIQVSNATAKISNVTATNKGSDNTTLSTTVFVFQNSDLTIENSKLHTEGGSEPYAIHFGSGSGAASTNIHVTVKDSEITSTYCGIIVYGIYINNSDLDSAVNADKNTLPSLTLENTTVKATSAALIGFGSSHGTVINIIGGTVTSDTTLAIYHPQYGYLDISGNAVIEGSSGIEMRAGNLTIDDASVTVTATGDFAAAGNTSGSTVDGAAIAISQHTTNLPINVTLSAGTYTATGENGKAVYEKDLQTEPKDDINVSITGGSYNGAVESENCTQFIYGGNFSVLPDATAFAEGLTGELGADGRYEVVLETEGEETITTPIERIEAQANVRSYLGALGLSVDDLSRIENTTGYEAVYSAAQAAVAAYNAILTATTQSQVADNLVAALDAVDAYKAALDAAKADAIDDLEKAAAANEEEGTAAVAVPTYALSAINAAKTPAEIEDYVTAATKEIDELKEQCKAAAEQVESIKQVLEVLQGTDGESGIAAQIAAIEALLGKSTDSATASTIFGMLNDLKSDVASAFNDVAASVDRSMAGVERELDALSAAIEALSGGVDEEALLAAVKAAEEAATAAGSKVDALETLLEGKLDSIDTAITEVNGAIDSVATAQDALKTAVESYKSELTTTVEGLEAAIESIREDVKALTDASAEDRLAVLEQLTKLQTTADGLASAIEALESGTAEDLTALASQLTTLGTSVGNVESVVATIAEDGATSTDLIAVYVCLGVSLALAAATLVLVILKKRS